MRFCLFAGTVLFLGFLATGCEGNREMTIEEAVAEVCVCANNASSSEEVTACADESSPSGQVAKAYGKKLKAEGIAKEDLMKDPLVAQMGKCMMAAGFKLMK